MAKTKKEEDARFRIIDTLLLWEGQVDNQRLRSLLKIKNVQASRLLTEYARLNPGKVHRPSPRAPYHAITTAAADTSAPHLDDYLMLVRRSSEQLDKIVEDARIDLTIPAPRVFSVVLQASRARVGLEIDYRSMSNPGGKKRLIFPHAIVRAGRRWHVRAWCAERREYRDFVIGRIRSANIVDQPWPPRVGADAAWETTVTVVLGAHPELAPEQARVIRDEYFAGAVSRRIVIRSCFVAYTIQDLRAAVDAKTERPPDFQLVVTNSKELKHFLFPEPSFTTKTGSSRTNGSSYPKA